MRRHHLPRTGHTGLGGTGSPAQGVVGVSFRALAGASCSKNRAQRNGGDGESRPGGGRSILQGPWGGIIFQERQTGLGGTGSPAQGVVGVSFRAHGEASSSKNGAHRPRGDGESSPGGGQRILEGPCGGIIFQEPGTPAWGGRGVEPTRWSKYPSGPLGKHHFPRTGHTGLGGRGVQPRGWSGYPSGPLGGHHLPRTGHTGLGGTGSPAQGVVGVSFKGPWRGIIFQEPGTPAWRGWGV